MSMTDKPLTLHPPSRNRRRSYGVQYYLNGTRVDQPVILKSGDKIAGIYLGGNVFQSENAAAATQLKSLGLVLGKGDEIGNEIIL